MFQWYETVNENTLEQGDIFVNFPIVNSEIDDGDLSRLAGGEVSEEISPEADIKLSNVIVLSQSCDLVHEKTDSVILCPIWNFTQMELGRSKKNEIRSGKIPHYHMLNEFSDSTLTVPFYIVEFSRVYTTSKAGLIAFAEAVGPRPRLNPPYREHLSQSFARYFMRVGLPTDIPAF